MDEDEFLEHIKIIEDDTINISNPRVVLMHPYCREIISEGRRIIPTIIKYYNNNPELMDILLSNVVGYREDDWLEWAKRRGYLT